MSEIPDYEKAKALLEELREIQRDMQLLIAGAQSPEELRVLQGRQQELKETIAFLSLPRRMQ